VLLILLNKEVNYADDIVYISQSVGWTIRQHCFYW